MRLVSLQLENIRSHERLRLDLEDVQAAAIVGRNGAGKSTILMAIDWALYGEGSPDDMLRLGADRGGVTLHLRDDRGMLWSVARGRERNKKSWLNLSDSAADHTCRTIAETQDRVDELMGMDVEAFRASIYAPQGSAGLLSAMAPRDRKDLLAGLLGIDRFEAWRQECAAAGREHMARATALDVERERLRSQREVLEQEAADDPVDENDVQAAAAQVAALEDELGKAIAREGDREKVQRRAALVRQATALRERAKRAKAEAARRAELEAQVAAGAAVRTELAEFEAAATAAREKWDAAVAARRAYETQVAEAQRTIDYHQRFVDGANEGIERYTAEIAHIEFVKPEPPTAEECPTCGQEIHGDAAKRVADHHAAMVEAWEGRLQDARDRLADAEKRLADVGPKLREAVAAREAIAEVPEPPALNGVDHNRLDQLRREVGSLDRLAGMVEAIEPEDVDDLRRQFDEVKAEADALPTEVPDGPTPEDVRADLAEARESHAAVLDAALQAQRRAAEIEGLADEERQATDNAAKAYEEVSAYDVLERAFGRNGIPAMILDNAVAGIEHAANETLERLGTALRLRMVTQVAKKSGKGMIETLEILVDDGVVERSLEGFSGGERYRVHVALRMGLADVLAAGTGVQTDFLLIDEPTDLDAEGVGLLADLLVRTGRQVLLVTHQGELVQAMPQRVVVDRASDAMPSEVTVA